VPDENCVAFCSKNNINGLHRTPLEAEQAGSAGSAMQRNDTRRTALRYKASDYIQTHNVLHDQIDCCCEILDHTAMLKGQARPE
jgi:hypothetical protein